MWDFATDVATIGDYIAILIAGPSRANLYPSRPLGNSFLLPTLANCTNIHADNSNNQVQRSIYINNIPTGNIPLLSSMANQDFTTFRGLIPGIAQNLEVLNPIALTEQLFAGGSPDCQYVTLPIMDSSGIISEQSGYMTNVDLSILDPCSISQFADFSGNTSQQDINLQKWANWNKKTSLKTPVPCAGDSASTFTSMEYGACSCSSGNSQEGFKNINSNNEIYDQIFNEKNLTEFYIIILGILGLYILLKILHKNL